MANITLKIYGQDDEIVKELHRSTLRWGVLKKAIRMEAALRDENTDPMDQMDEITGLLEAVFDGQTSAEEIEAGATMEEIFACFASVVAAAQEARKGNFQKGTRPKAASRTM